MKIGILGFTGSGKKSIFQLLTGVDAGARHTGGVVPGVARVQDPRVDRLAEIYKPRKITHAEIEFLLIPDVEIGGTRGVAWLGAVRDCDAVCMVVRDFDAPSVFHPHDTVDPIRDAKALETELILADLGLVETRLQNIEKDVKHSRDPRLVKEKADLEAMQAHLEAEKPLRTMEWDDRMSPTLRSLGFLTRRARLVVRNTDSDAISEPSGEMDLSETVPSVLINVQMELEVAALEDPEEQATFLKELGIEEPAIAVLTRAMYKAVGFISFFTGGDREVHAWTIRRGTLVAPAAGKIHTDLERGFIRAEVVPYESLIEAGSEAAAKAAGTWMLKGKDYVVQDGDVILVRFSV